MVQNLDRLDAVCRRDLKLGDCARVRTRNSTYSILVLGNDLYSVSGGWFDLKGFSPMTTTIVGCTWGGKAIKSDLIAACGLHLEFGNRVVTTAIQKVDVVRFEQTFEF